jgi:AcrR family transcriptional regulator
VSRDDPLLDAARDCVLAVGVRRTTLTDVARRAGISRMTVYRRFPDMTALLQAVMTREFGVIIAAEDAGDHPGENARERFVDQVLHGTQSLVEHPLFRRILDVDPELVLPYFSQRYGAFQRAVLENFAVRIADGVADGSIRDADPRVLAATVEMALRGFVLSAQAEDGEGLRPKVLEQLRIVLDRGLAPSE